jgi:predicted unusual protein kinase regulating ubiquinone biosynthesis (AarF/ABC1/UbiB family)
VLPSHLVYFARTAALIEGLGTHYDPHFNALAFATPIAISLRARIISSLYPDGNRPTVDPAKVLGAAIGAVARVLRETGENLVSAVRGAVAEASLPSDAALGVGGRMPLANGSPPIARSSSE